MRGLKFWFLGCVFYQINDSVVDKDVTIRYSVFDIMHDDIRW